MVNPSQFLDPDVFLVVSREHLLTSYLHPPPPHEHCLFVLIIPADLPFPQPDDWKTGPDVTPRQQRTKKYNCIHWLQLKYLIYLLIVSCVVSGLYYVTAAFN